MSVVVGYTPSKGGRGSLDLGLQLAHALDEPMAVVTVVPRQWSTPSMARVDAEYGEYARQVAEEAERQAREAGHGTQDELHLLTTHGVLHLLGYDHAEEDEHREMFGLQDELLTAWRASRSD